MEKKMEGLTPEGKAARLDRVSPISFFHHFTHSRQGAGPLCLHMISSV